MSGPTAAETLAAAPADTSALQAAAVHDVISDRNRHGDVPAAASNSDPLAPRHRQCRNNSHRGLLTDNEKAPDHVTVAEGRARVLAPMRSPEASLRISDQGPFTEIAGAEVAR